MNKLNSGELSVSPSGILNTIIRLLLGEVYSAAGAYGNGSCRFGSRSYLQGLKDGFGSNSVANCAFYVCYIVAAGVTAAAFYQAAECTTAAVKNTAVFMRIIVPVMIGALTASGAAISAATLEPAILGMMRDCRMDNGNGFCSCGYDFGGAECRQRNVRQIQNRQNDKAFEQCGQVGNVNRPDRIREPCRA